jgi:hypothetical protein
LGTELTVLYKNSTTSIGRNAFRPSFAETKEYISLDITFESDFDNESANELLKASAIDVDFISFFSRMCSTRVPIQLLKEFVSIDSVQLLRPVKAKTQVCSVTCEGDRAMFAHIARSKYFVNRSGLFVGVFSDSYNYRGGASYDILSEDLPDGTNSVVVFEDLSPENCIHGAQRRPTGFPNCL